MRPASALGVVGRWRARHPDRTLLFVTHSGLFDALHERIFGSRMEPRHVPYLGLPEEDGRSCNAL